MLKDAIAAVYICRFSSITKLMSWCMATRSCNYAAEHTKADSDPYDMGVLGR